MMMKYSLVLLVAALSTAEAFAPSSRAFTTTTTKTATTQLMMAQVPLEPEPEGGEELSGSSTMEGTRIKKMDPLPEIKSDDGPVYQFWLSTIAQGELIKEYKVTIMKDAKSKANFPGFRKGQIPPYAIPQINNFAVQEGIVKTIEQAVAAFGLKSLQGSDGEVNVLEDVAEMSKGYKDGTSLEFTATVNLVFDPEKIVAAEDVEIESTDAEEVDAE